MLSKETQQIIKSTAPILRERGTEITSRFYERLFEQHPELLNLFNQTNQKKGRQQTALANSVLAAAENIDQLEQILPVVKQIAHKHRSIGVLPEHYPIVGEHLLIAMKEVLGDGASQEVLSAWGDAYQVLADVFIHTEDEMYQHAAEQPGGWSGFKPFYIDQIVQESDVITSFYLKPVDQQPVPTFKPGQYISLQLNIPGETYTHVRQYSLSDEPGLQHFRISVKRESEHDPEGVVSNYLHDSLQEGDHIRVSAPAGDFILDTQKETPLVLISGGVGITPMMSMLKTVASVQPKRPVTFIHAAQNSNAHALKHEVEQLGNQMPDLKVYTIYSNPSENDRSSLNHEMEGYVTLEWLQKIIPHHDCEFYFCGPVGFMEVISDALHRWGVPEESMHYEFFGPSKTLEPTQQ